MLLLVSAHPLWPLPRGDIILDLAPLHHLLHIRGQPEGPRRPRGPRIQAQGSHPLRDPRRHPHRLIRELLEPRIYPLHLLSGGLPFIVDPSRGMLTAVGETCTGRFSTISWHLPRTRSSETPCPLMQRYHLESFMMPRRYFYPRVVIEFYHTMTSR